MVRQSDRVAARRRAVETMAACAGTTVVRMRGDGSDSGGGGARRLRRRGGYGGVRRADAPRRHARQSRTLPGWALSLQRIEGSTNHIDGNSIANGLVPRVGAGAWARWCPFLWFRLRTMSVLASAA
jgi:hypothetical protein